jgi:hypothetical protein
MGTFLVLRNALAWIRRKAGLRSKLQRRLADDLEEIAKRCARLPVLDERSADEILGFAKHPVRDL